MSTDGFICFFIFYAMMILLFIGVVIYSIFIFLYDKFDLEEKIESTIINCALFISKKGVELRGKSQEIFRRFSD